MRIADSQLWQVVYLCWDFPGGPEVKDLPFSAWEEGSSLVRELGSHMTWDN